jgi:hypothetical protein
MRLFSFRLSDPSGPLVDPYAGDLAYCTRLLDVYRELRNAGTLLAEPPTWITEQFGKDLVLLDTPQMLQSTPRVQAALASITSYTPSKWLLEQELSVRESRRPQPLSWDHPAEQSAHLTALTAHGEETLAARPFPAPDPDSSTPPPSWSFGSEDVYTSAAREVLSGLCFSGGGIRSATFNLGVLQALASAGKLGRFDYLSTVSGGGYIHEWFASWIRNEPGRFAVVQSRLRPLPGPGSGARSPEQITWLRRYSSYLTPRRGILSADTWTMFAIWFRNTFLNQIVLFAFLILCLLSARSITYLFTFYVHGSYHLDQPHLGWFVFAVLLISTVFFWRALASQSESSTPSRPAGGSLSNKGVVFLIVLPAFLISIAVSLESMGALRLGEISGFFLCYAAYIFMTLVALTIGGKGYRTFKLLRSPGLGGKAAFHLGSFVSILSCTTLAVVLATLAYFNTGAPAPPPVSQTILPAAAVPGPGQTKLPPSSKFAMESASKSRPEKHASPVHDSAAPVKRLPSSPMAVVEPPPTKRGYVPNETLLYRYAQIVAAFLNRHMYPQSIATSASQPRPPHPVTPQALYAIVAPLIFFCLLFVAMRLQLGLLGRFYTEERREWLARLGGWSAIVSVLWIALSGIGTLGPIVFYWVFAPSAPASRRLSGLAATLAVHAVTLFSGASGKSDGKPKPDKLLGYSFFDLLSMIGAPLCILSLLIIASGLIDMVTDSAYEFSHYLPFALSLVVLAIFFLFGWRIDVNEFSLHGFYRNRLARCYLGATNPRRSPDPFTGFDEHTEATTQSGMRLSELLPKRFGGKGFNEGETPADRLPYDGPFPIFCSTLNLTFGEDLAWQDRKGACFAFTPLYSGYHVGWTGATGINRLTTFNGYVPTEAFAYPNTGIHLATVTAISGAALSPNMGYSSQPAVAFLMTLFNVRLGWWLANPRRPKIWPQARRRPTPRIGIWYLLRELFGFSSDTSNYVCLSDGGHFENMGVYELVRRRCMLIVICDAESDSEPCFEGIGLAIAKCRTDFGAEITLDLTPLIPADDGPTAGLAAEHFRVGTIQYPAPPGSSLPLSTFLGKVVYLKTSITGDETADILHYRRTFPKFPQDSTLNQWFSETQFESYRRLGQLIGEEVVGFI